MYEIWRTLKRPFRYPTCAVHRWETFDANAAGCRGCGKLHQCAGNAVDNTCPLAEGGDGTRSCLITGLVLSEVVHAQEEYLDTCAVHAERRGGAGGSLSNTTDLEEEIGRVLFGVLLGPKAVAYRQDENTRQARKISSGLHKALRQAKLKGLKTYPNICQFLALIMAQERNLRLVRPASRQLVGECAKKILVCLVDLRAKGVKFSQGPRLEGLIVGLLYLLRTGLTFKNRVLLGSIEEIAWCLPFENRLESYFGISSKILTEVENEIKLVYRSCYQD